MTYFNEENWNVRIERIVCPYKYHEIEDFEWYEVCELTKKKCNMLDCPIKEDENI